VLGRQSYLQLQKLDVCEDVVLDTPKEKEELCVGRPSVGGPSSPYETQGSLLSMRIWTKAKNFVILRVNAIVRALHT
jgi:hypothetical protein